MSSLRGALGFSPRKVPIGVTTFVSHVLPPVICYLVFAVLAVTPRTRTIRVALWPVLALLALRATVFIDMSLGKPETKFLDTDLMLSMLYITVYSLSWVSPKKPLVRRLRPANSSPSVIMDALDLILNSRGIGWDWSRGSYVPRETRPTNRMAFAFYVLVSAAAHTFFCGFLYLAIRTFTAGAGSGLSTTVYTIYDDTLPFFMRYLRASIISTFAAFAVYTGLQLQYDLLTLLGVVLFRQDPVQWPPAFDRPWCATSLGDFWSRRWHQWLRHMFLMGAYPLYVVFGRAGRVVGAFLASAVFHHIVMLTFDSRSELWRMLVGFGIMGPGILAERTFYKLTGRKVGGVAGWAWTMAWLISGGCVMVDGLTRVGLFMSSTPIDSRLPGRALIEKLVADFDSWLHTIRG